MVSSHHTGCLEPEVVAAYVDHGLSLAERAQVETHLASCRPCTALLAGVVRTAAEIAAFIPDTGVTEATPFRTRRTVLVALGAAAAVFAVLVVPSTVRPWLERDAGLVSLVDSVGEQRSVLGRLSGGFPHAPLSVSSAGGQDGQAAGTDRVLLTAGRIRESFGELETPSRLHALGISQLLAGQYDDAVQSLLAASREQPANAQYLSDVAAVQLERARLGLRPDDLPRALAAADRARRLDPSLTEAWFNRALALSALSLTDQAKVAWTEYLQRDSASPWAGEARRRLEELSKPTPAAAWASIEVRLQQSIDDATADEAVRTQTTEARNFIENQLFVEWANAVLAGSDGTAELHRLRVMADAMLRVTGDALYRDAVAAIDSARTRGAKTMASLAAAHDAYAKAAASFLEDRFADAAPGLLSAKLRLAATGSSYANRASLDLGAVAYFVGRATDAETILGELLLVAQSKNYGHIAARATWQLGLVSFGQGRLGDAQLRYEETLAQFERLGDAEETAAANNLLASLFGYLGDEDRAWRHREAALPILTITRSQRLRYGVLVGATAAARRQDPQAALIFQDIVVETAQAWGRQTALAESLSHKGELLAAVGRHDEAAAHVSAARNALQQIPDEGLRRRFEVTVLAAESTLARSHSPQVAVRAAERAMQLVDERRDRRRLPQLNLLLAKANIASGRIVEAERALAQGIRAFETERASLSDEGRLSVLDDSWELFDTAVYVAIKKGDLARAFEMSEKARYRTLAESKSVVPMSLVEVERSLAADEAILALNQFDDALAVWLIKREGTTATLRPIRKSDASKFMARQLDEIHLEARTPRASAELFNEIIRPIGNRLKSVTRLVVVPDATYENVRFAALWESSRKQFLIEKFSVAMAPSASAHAHGLARANADTVAAAPLVFGGPGPTSERDARNVASVYEQAALRTGAQATSSRFFAEVAGRAVVHLAAPAVANAAFPFLSAFSVADEPGRRHSGNVLARDIAARSLSTTRLVVIDEVETTNHNRGEGTLALARAFLAAGVPAVLGTLPGADESATRDLMVGFHRRIASKMTPAEALTDLQRNVLQSNGRRLGAWSALVMYGSDR